MLIADFFSTWPDGFAIAFQLGQDQAAIPPGPIVRQSRVTISDAYSRAAPLWTHGTDDCAEGNFADTDETLTRAA